MDKQNEHLETLTEIRSMMERSSRFISLSGLSGVSAGVFALIGATVAFYHFNLSMGDSNFYKFATLPDGSINYDFFIFCFINGGAIFVASITAGIFFTVRKAKKKGLGIWDATAQRVIIQIAIPLV